MLYLRLYLFAFVGAVNMYIRFNYKALILLYSSERLKKQMIIMIFMSFRLVTGSVPAAAIVKCDLWQVIA